MKSNAHLSHFRRFSMLFVLLSLVFLFGINSCQQNVELTEDNSVPLKSGTLPQGNILTFWGHETFTRSTGEPVVVKKKIGSADLQHFEPGFTIHLQNGDGMKNLVSSAIVTIDGKQIFVPSDFSQAVKSLSKEITGLTENSEIEVEIRGDPKSCINLWIEGILKPGHALFTPEGGIISIMNGLIKIELPQGAVEKPLFITVKDLYEGIPAALQLNDSKKYELLPHGIIFSHPVLFTFPFQSDPEAYFNSITAYSMSDGKWEELKISNIDESLKTVQLEINHFSYIFLNTPNLYLVVDIPGKFLNKGDLIYTLTQGIGGEPIYSPDKFYWVPGHVGLYLGTRDKFNYDNDGESIIESTPDKVRFSTINDFINSPDHLYVGPRRYNGTISDIQRNGIAGFSIDQKDKPYSLVGQGNTNNSSFSCVGLTEATYDANGLSIIPSDFETNLIYPYDQYKLTKPIDQITIKSGEKVSLNVYGIIYGIVKKYTKTADGVNIASLPSGSSWEYKINSDFLSGYYKFSWTPTQSDVGKVIPITFNISNSLGNKNQTISFNVIQGNTTETGSFTDSRDGITYKTVKIGTQWWMAENLKATKYIDGTAIPNVTSNLDWAALTTGAYCWYNNDITNKSTYGALYNWYAVNTQKLAPIGWHVPTDAEWTTLTNYLGGEIIAGGKMKETGTSHWVSPNTDATNESGFTAVPGGHRNFDGHFHQIGNYAFWWSSVESSATNALNRYIYTVYGNLAIYNYDKRDGFSVRCIKD